MQMPTSQRCGLVAIVGAPNAGKSTLVNALVGQKVAITSPKAQTTRTRLLGVALEGDAQIMLVDTPGSLEDTAVLETVRYLRDIAWPDPAIEAQLLFAQIDGMCQHYVLDPAHYPLERLIERLIARYTGRRAS